MMIVIQKDKQQETADLFFDKEGLELLRSVFNKNWREPMQDTEGLYDFDHEHLSSKEWGGEELRPELTTKDLEKIHSLKILYLGQDAENLFE